MDRPDVVLHIGLHKTATRFLQRALFSSLDARVWLFNPTYLMRPLRRALRYRDADSIEAARVAVADARREAGERSLLVSEPHIAGDMYSGYADWRENLDLVRELFPKARIVYFVRRHADWLHSAYRQVLAKGPGIPIEFFLNFRDGEFCSRPGRFVGGARNLEALRLQFLDIYRGYIDAYGADQVYLFRQEDLRSRPDDVYARLAQALGCESLPPLPERVSGNRGMSALAIHLFFPGVHIQRRGVARDAPRRRPLQVTVRRLRRWRTMFIRHVFDKLVYRDWDLLARHGMRARIDAHYEHEEAILARAAQAILDRGPGAHVESLVRSGREDGTS